MGTTKINQTIRVVGDYPALFEKEDEYYSNLLEQVNLRIDLLSGQLKQLKSERKKLEKLL